MKNAWCNSIIPTNIFTLDQLVSTLKSFNCRYSLCLCLNDRDLLKQLCTLTSDVFIINRIYELRLALCGIVCRSNALAHFIPGSQWVFDSGVGCVFLSVDGGGLASGFPAPPSAVLFLVFSNSTQYSLSPPPAFWVTVDVMPFAGEEMCKCGDQSSSLASHLSVPAPLTPPHCTLCYVRPVAGL